MIQAKAFQEVQLGDAGVEASTKIATRHMICCQCYRLIPKGKKYVSVAYKGWPAAAAHFECTDYV